MARSTPPRRRSQPSDGAPGLFDFGHEPERRAEDPGRSDPPESPGAAREPPARRRRHASAEDMAARQRDISVSEFFAKNRHLLGFDNKRKALLTTVKEAVDNSLDACEEAGILPDLHIAIVQLGEDRFRVTVRDNGPGIVKAQIPNIFGKLLYGSKFHRLKMARGQQGIGISAAGMYGLITTGKPIHVTSRTKGGRPAHHFQIAIDTTKNRPDIVKDEEQEVAWERGTEVAIELVASYARGRQSVDEYVEQTAIANPHASITYRLMLAGSANGSSGPPGAPAPGPVVRVFPRASFELPPETREIQPHPHGIELGVLMKMLKEAAPAPSRGRPRVLAERGDGPARSGGRRGREDARARSISGFLQHRFCRVSSKVAHEICAKAGVRPTARPADLGPAEAERLYQAMQSVRIMAPPTDCLAPIGVRAMLAGLLKEVKAEFFTATTRDPSVYRGNPFLIEAGIAYGGELSRNGAGLGSQPPPAGGVLAESPHLRAASEADQPARVLRFANRVPLLYQQSACAAFKSALDVDWRNYGLSQPGGGLPVGPLVLMIHMASVWVPFTSESKEAIADYDEIRKEMKLALQECGRKLAAYIRRRRRQRLEGERRSIFERYVADVADALASITGASETRLVKDLQAIARRRTADADLRLDEDGRPIDRASAAGDDAKPRAAGRMDRRGAEGPVKAGERLAGGATEAADELIGDDSTIIVEENVAQGAAPGAGLFETGGGASSVRGRRPRGAPRRRRTS